MVAVKKHQQLSLSRSDFDWRAAKAGKAFSGFIFVCNNNTFPDLECRIFGLPAHYEDSVRAIRRGMPLFLYNYSERRLYGVFEAASDGGFNIDPYAWGNVDSNRSGRYSNPVSRYPAQVKVRRRADRAPLDYESFRHLLDHLEGNKFRLQLTARQVQRLLHLFDSSLERDRNRNTLYPPLEAQDPESPTSAFNKSDSDCYSECSSRGTNSGEEEWTDDGTNEKLYFPQGDGDGVVSERFGHLTLDGMNGYDNGGFDSEGDKELVYNTSFVPGISSVSEDHFSASDGNGHVFAWDEGACQGANDARSEILQENSVLLRLHDDDPAVNSSSINCMEQGVNQTLPMGRAENVVTLPMLPSQVQSHFPAGENIILIPVQTVQCQPQTVQCQQRDVSVQPQRLKWNEQKKFLRGWPNSKPSSQDRSYRPKDNRYQKQQSRSDNQPQLQISQVLVPICTQRQGSLQDQGHMATLLSQVFIPPNSENITYAQSQTAGVRVEDSDEVYDMVNNGQMLPDGLQPIMQRGHFPILLMPSVIPRLPASPSPITVGFVEALHFDILNFARLTRPSAETQRHVKAAIDCVRKGVKMVWPEADVEVFGSFATGLCLQHSDVDLAVIDAPRLPSSENLSIAQASASLIRELASALRAYEWCESINSLDTASMPVLKCLCRPFGLVTNSAFSIPAIAIDITIGGMRNSDFVWSPETRVVDTADQAPRIGNFMTRHTGGAAREYVLRKIQELPALAPLVLLLKSFLHHRSLSNVYSGGLGSFSLTLLVAFFLERVPISRGGLPVTNSSDSPGSPSASSSLVSCSSDCSDDSEAQCSSCSFSGSSGDSSTQSLGEHYVRRAADVIERVLSLWDSGSSPYLGTLLLGFLQTFGFQLDLSREKIVLKGLDGSPGGFFGRNDRHVALWIDDPLRPGVNVGAGSFAMVHVQTAFKEMLQVLTKQSDTLSSRLQCDDKDCQDLAVMGLEQLSCLSRLIVEDHEY